jgi:beta-mannosidase
VQVLGHHPSIAVWCGHNEPMGIEVPTARTGRAFAAQQLPTWNKSILDRSIKRALEDEDGSRPVVAHSGVLPHPPQLDGTDSHLYFGWYWGVDHDFERLCAAMPRLARFVSEFGAQAVPADATFCEPDRWPDLDWELLEARHGLQKQHFDRYVPPSEYPTFAAWVDATQRYQASVIKHHVEALRRIKYSPTGGFAQFFLADCMPAVTCAVLDDQRRPKLGWGALAAACDPVIVVADRPPPTLAPGQTIELDVHVVSDLRRELAGCSVTAALHAADGAVVGAWRFGGDIPADSCVHVGTLRANAPASPGPVTLDLTLDGPVHATNAYESRVEP